MTTPDQKEGEPSKPAKKKKPFIPVENPKQIHAFDLYFAQGLSMRSVGRVAGMIGIPRKSVERWATRFHWVERVRQRDLEYAEMIRKRTDDEMAQQQSALLNFWKALLMKCMKKVNRDGKDILEVALEPKDVADAERISKMCLLLSGLPTERYEVVNVIVEKVYHVIDVCINDKALKLRVYEQLSGITAPGKGAGESAAITTAESGEHKDETASIS